MVRAGQAVETRLRRPRGLGRLGVLAVGVAVLFAGGALGAAPALALEGSDWQHALRVAQELRDAPPSQPVVLLLGGSSAREATVSDASWAADTARRGGPTVVAYNLGSRNQTFEQETALVGALPSIPMLIYIGVNRGRFTSPPTTTTSTTPEATKGTYTQHHYSSARIWTPARKEQAVQRWLRVRYPVFKERFAANLERLDKLVATCLRRGYRPVIVDLPRNMEVIGGAFDAPDDQYQEGCRQLASARGVPFLGFIDALGLENADFFDLDHLVDPGRPKFQGRLAEESARLLAGYGLGPDDEAGSGVLSRLTGAGALWAIAIAAMLLGVALAAQRRRVVLRRRRRMRDRRRETRRLR